LFTYTFRFDDAWLAMTAGVATVPLTILPLILRYFDIFLFKFEFQSTATLGVVGLDSVVTLKFSSSVLGSCSITYSLMTFLISSGVIAPSVGMPTCSVASRTYGK
jgi:hypothetical protein